MYSNVRTTTTRKREIMTLVESTVTTETVGQALARRSLCQIDHTQALAIRDAELQALRTRGAGLASSYDSTRHEMSEAIAQAQRSAAQSMREVWPDDQVIEMVASRSTGDAPRRQEADDEDRGESPRMKG